MELGVRDWMVIVGVLLIVAVLIDGFRRVRNERRGKIRMSLNKQYLNSGDDDESGNSNNNNGSSELPAGGARPAGRRSQSHAETVSDDISDNSARNNHRDSFATTELDLEQDVPMLMDSVNAKPRKSEPPVESLAAADNPDDSHDEFASLADERAVAPNETVPTPVEPTKERTSRAAVGQSQLTDIDDKEMVVINVVAKDEYFKGPDLLHILLACDVRFGEMNIFHRHEKANGTGAVQFSVANSVEPGDFNLDTIDDFTTPGVCFFMSVPGPEKVIEAFDCLVETAQCVVKNLNGELRDESRSVMTAQTLEHCRARLFEFERRQLAQQA